MKVDFLYEFSRSNPKVLEKFKSELRRTAKTKSEQPHLKTKRKILSKDERMKIVASIKVGNDGAHNFHKISFDNLIHIFGSRLSNPYSKREINEGRKRIDIVFDNSGKKGFFHSLNKLYHIQCPKIFAECKNYGKEIGNPEIDQLQNGFNSIRGRFGLLLCRSIQDRKLLVKRCKDAYNDNKSYIIVLENADVEQLLNFKEQDDENGIDNFMQKKLDLIIV